MDMSPMLSASGESGTAFPLRMTAGPVEEKRAAASGTGEACEGALGDEPAGESKSLAERMLRTSSVAVPLTGLAD
jgi:hypothetical protein